VSFLPNAHNAQIHPRKLTYLLTTGKAKFFGLHGFDLNRPLELDAALRAHPLRNQIESTETTIYGTKYLIRCSLPSPDGRDPCILSVWIVDSGETAPRFVTAYPSRPNARP
jgi:filamentous hemagglutinin